MGWERREVWEGKVEVERGGREGWERERWVGRGGMGERGEKELREVMGKGGRNGKGRQPRGGKEEGRG